MICVRKVYSLVHENMFFNLTETCLMRYDGYEILVNKKTNMSQKAAAAAQKANHVLGYIKGSMASRSREGILPLYSTTVRHHLEYCIQLWGLQHMNSSMVLSARVQRRATRTIRGLEHLLL